MTPVHLCVEGTKGAGKTTTIAGVERALRDEGWRVQTHALFHEGNEWARTQGFDGGVPMMEADPSSNERVVRWLIHRARAVRDAFFAEATERDAPSLLVSDRGWITLHAYLYEGAWAKAPHARPTIDALWSEALSSAPPTVFIHTRPEVSARRRAGALDHVSGLQTEARLRADYERRITLAREHPALVVASWETLEGPFVDLCPALVALVRSRSYAAR